MGETKNSYQRGRQRRRCKRDQTLTPAALGRIHVSGREEEEGEVGQEVCRQHLRSQAGRAG